MFKTKIKSKVLFIPILAMMVLAYACKKELINGESLGRLEDPAYGMNVDLAKKIFNDLKKEKGKFVKARKANPELSKTNVQENYNNRRYALYQKAYESETDKSTFVEIPLVYNQRYSLTVINPKTFAKTSVADRQLVFKYSFDRFIAYKNKKTGKISTRVVTYIPGLDYLKKHNYKIKHNQINKLDSDFSGFIEFKEWDGDGIYLLKYENGKRTGYISFKKAIRNKVNTLSAKRQSSSTMSANGCETYEVEEWGESCIDAGPESETSEPECTPYLIGIEIVTICDPETGDPCIDYGDCETGDPCIDYGDCGDGGGDPGTPPVENQTELNTLFALENSADSYKNRMSPQELAIYNNMSLVDKISYLSNAQHASAYAGQEYPNSLYNGKGDAFRHAYFNALNAEALGLSLAASLATAHEANTPAALLLEKQMDLFNNKVGRDVLTEKPWWQSTDDYIDDMMTQGKLRYLDPLNFDGTIIPGVTQLKPTNQ